MKRRGHVVFAAVTTLAAIYILDRFVLDLPAAIVALGLAEAIASSALPDMFEPGGNTSHRRGAHSWRAMAATLLICAIGAYMMPQDVLRFHALFFLPWGYATHLMADALTPAGLPY
jgi:membrane-bound metal-dependent hydrolase YbcI (DUF457 family)